MEQNILSWEMKVKKKHDMALAWEKLAVIPLGIVIGGLSSDKEFGERELFFLRHDYKMAFGIQMRRFEPCLHFRSDIVPVLFVDFGQALIPSMFEANVIKKEGIAPWIEPIKRGYEYGR